jgi:hypothetical protein
MIGGAAGPFESLTRRSSVESDNLADSRNFDPLFGHPKISGVFTARFANIGFANMTTSFASIPPAEMS